MPSEDAKERIEELLLECLERPDEERAAALEQLCRDHPELADRLRRRFATLQRMGMLAPGEPELPERLGEYRILRELGRGGMGVVYLAEQEQVGRRVALKLIRPELLHSPRSRERFRRELHAASRLEHPGICAVHDAGEVEGRPFIAMRHVDGVTLAERIARAKERGAPPSQAEVLAAVQLVERVARAIHAAHEAGLIHRDLKPGNVMITGAGEPVVLDFGLARDESADQATLTLSGDLVGTPAYMSPEQVAGKGAALDRTTDVYSLGATLYECLTLHCPFESESRPGLYQQILNTEPPDPLRLNRHIPRDLRAVLRKAMDKEPVRRYPSALALAEDLRRVRDQEPVEAREAGPLLRLGRWAQRNPFLAAALSLLFFALSAGLVVSLILLANVNWALEQRLAIDLAIASGDALERDTQLALLLALEAVEVEENVRTLSSLYAALNEFHERRIMTHGTALTCADVADDEQTFVVGDWWGGAYIFTRGRQDFGSAVELPFKGEEDMPVHTVEFSPDGETVLVATFDPTAHLWSREGRHLRSFAHDKRVTSACFTPDGQRIVTTSGDGKARLWSLESDDPEVVFEKHTDEILCSAVSRDGEFLLTGSCDTTARLWRIDDGSLVAELQGHEGWVSSVAFSPTEKRIVTTTGWDHRYVQHFTQPALQDFTVRIWDWEGNPLHEFAEHEYWISSARFSADGLHLLTTSGDCTARLWRNISGMTEIIPLPHGGEVFAGRFSPDGTCILTLCFDGSANLWDLHGRHLAAMRGHANAVSDGFFLAQGRQVFTVGWDLTARFWDSEPRLMPRLRMGKLVSAAYSSDGNAILGFQEDGTIARWEREGMSYRRAGITRLENTRWNTAALMQSDRLLVATSDWKVQLIELDGKAKAETVLSLEKEEGHLRATISPDEQLIVTRSLATIAQLWSIDGEPIAKLPHDGSVMGVAFSRDSELFATASTDGRVRVWDRRGKLRDEDYPPQDNSISRVAFLPSGDQVLVGTLAGAVEIWNWKSDERRAIASYRNSLIRLAVSTDGNTLAGAFRDGSIQLWRSDGEPLVILPSEGGEFYLSLTFSQDGSKLLAASWQGTVREWNVSTEELIERAERACIRPFTAEERDIYHDLLDPVRRRK